MSDFYDQFKLSAARVYSRKLCVVIAFILLNACNNNASVKDLSKMLGASSAISSIDITPNVVDFGNQTVGQVPKPLIVTIQAKGEATVFISDITSNNQHFAVSDDVAGAVDRNGCIGKSIAISESCSFAIQYVPMTEGSETANFEVIWGLSAGARSESTTFTTAGKGTLGTSDQLVFTPETVEFGSVIPGSVGKPSANVTINLLNQAAKSAYLGTISSSSESFIIVSHNCPTGGTPLPAGASCDIVTQFLPATSGDMNGKLRVIFGNRSELVAFKTEATLHGTSLDPVAAITLAPSFSPSTWNFGLSAVGMAAAPKTVTLTNTSVTNVYLSAISVPTSPSDYSVSGDTCPKSPSPLPSGVTCQFTVGFTPSAAGPRPDFVDVKLGFSPATSANATSRYSLTGLGQIVMSFGGITSIPAGQIGGTSLTATWALESTGNAASYKIYTVDGSGNLTLKTTVSAPGTTGVVNGLTPNTTYTLRVRAADQWGSEDSNSVDVSATTLPNAPPVISTVTPSFGPLTSATTITINGTGFQTGVAVTVGGAGCGSLVRVSSTQITCSAPAHIAGVVPVVVTNTDTQATTNLTGFEYRVSFSGLATVDQVTGNSMRLNWSNSADASTYNIYKIVSGTPIYVASTASPTATYTATGLTNATSYTWRVRALTSYGVGDSNTSDITQATLANPTPTISGISPLFGKVGGGTTVTITGTGFVSGAVVNIGASPCGSVAVVSATSITCVTPSKATGGFVDVAVTNSDGQSATATNAFEFKMNFPGLNNIATPVSGVQLTLNWALNTDAIDSYHIYTVDGSGNPTFLASVGPSVAVYNATGLTPGTTYKFRVRAFNNSGISDSNTNDLSAATLANSPPTITSVSPTTGVTSGGTTLTLTGTGFIQSPAPTISIGSTSCASVTWISSTSVSCVTPAKSAATYDVTLTNSDGQSVTSTSAFRYTQFAGLASIDQIGGTSMRLNWTDTSDGASYQIYSVSGGVATLVTSMNSPGTLSNVTYTVTNLNTSTSYTYRVRATNSSSVQDGNLVDRTANTLNDPPPTITSVSPTAGSLAGTDTITVNGTGFLATPTVTIGGSSCASVVRVSATRITCTRPAKSAGTYNIVVTNPDTQSVTATSAHTYQPAPTVTSVTPASGTYKGGTNITISGTGFVSGASVLIGTTFNVSDGTSNGTTTITLGSAPSTTLTAGMGVAGFGIPAGAYISSLASQTSFTLSSAATSSVSGNLSLTFGINCANPSTTSSTEITCTTGAYTTNTVRSKVDIKVLNADAQSGSVTNAFIYGVDTVTHLAGQALNVGCTDGSNLTNARFASALTGMLVDGTDIYLSDDLGRTIRKLSMTSNTVATVGGQPCNSATPPADGIAGSAQIRQPYQLVKIGNYLYFADTVGNKIRRLDISGGANQGSIVTIAGTGTSGSADNATGTSAAFNTPKGLAASSDGNYLYVADSANNLIRRVDLTSGTYNVTTFAGSTTTAGFADGAALTTAQFSSPRNLIWYQSGATCATYGCLLVADSANSKLRYIPIQSNGSAGSVVTFAGSSVGGADGNGTAAQFNTPTWLALSGSNLYVSSTGRHTIKKIDLSDFSTFAVTTVVGYDNSSGWMDGDQFYVARTGTRTINSATVTGFSTTADLSVGLSVAGTGISTGTTIAAIPNSTSITLSGNATQSGTTSLSFSKSARTESPQALAVYGGELYFSDATATIRKLSSSNVVSTVVSVNPQYATGVAIVDNSNTTPGVTDQPSYARFRKDSKGAITTDGTNIYVADYTNHAIRKIVAATGYTTTISGTGALGGTDGASVGTATHYNPYGIAYESSSNTLYVADFTGHTIRAVNLSSGQTSTIAGLYSTTGGTDDPVGTNARFNNPSSLAIDTSTTPHYLYVGETTGARIRRVALTGTYAVTTIAGTGTTGTSDGYGTSAQGSPVATLDAGPMAFASYTNGGTTYKKLFFIKSAATGLRALDLSSGYVQTLTSTTAGYLDTGDPAVGSSDTLSARMSAPRTMFWDGTHLLIADMDYSIIKRFDPITGTLGNVINTYLNATRTYSSTVNSFTVPYYDSINTGSISAGTGTIAQPSAITFVPNIGYIIGNIYGFWKVN